MQTVDDYCNAAIAQQGYRSDRELSKALGFNANSVTAFRTKRAWPSDATMVRLADLAGMDRERALVDLNTWRTEGPAQACYQQIARKLAATAATVLIFLGLQTAIVPGHTGNKVTPISPEVSIMRQRRRRFMSWCSPIPLPA